jgi:hypothetical protein
METKTKRVKKAIERKVNKLLDEHKRNREALLQEQEDLLNDSEEYRP